MDRLADKLESIYNAAGGKKINIISHSMGGLLVKCFMCLQSDVTHLLNCLFRFYFILLFLFNLIIYICQYLVYTLQSWNLSTAET